MKSGVLTGQSTKGMGESFLSDMGYLRGWFPWRESLFETRRVRNKV